MSVGGKQSIKRLNRTLRKLRKSAKRVEQGRAKAKHVTAAEQWLAVSDAGCKKRCCGKSEAKMCKRCPRRVFDARPVRACAA